MNNLTDRIGLCVWKEDKNTLKKPSVLNFHGYYGHPPWLTKGRAMQDSPGLCEHQLLKTAPNESLGTSRGATGCTIHILKQREWNKRTAKATPLGWSLIAYSVASRATLPVVSCTLEPACYSTTEKRIVGSLATKLFRYLFLGLHAASLLASGLPAVQQDSAFTGVNLTTHTARPHAVHTSSAY